MLPALLLQPEAHHHVLDMCAAPGSKSIQLLEAMEAAAGEATDATSGSATDATASGSDVVGGGQRRAPSGVLVANDASLARTISLTHRLTSVNVGAPHTVVTSLDGRYWPDGLLSGAGSVAGGSTPFRFDRVLCDVPCSGDGTLRKRHANTPPWRVAAAVDLHSTQSKLLREGLYLLAAGGRLVFSTCSFNPIENEATVVSVLRSLGARREEYAVEDPRVTHPHLFRNGAAAENSDGRDGHADPGSGEVLQGLYAAPGLTSWSVPPDAPARMHPPDGDEIADLVPLLQKCIRLLPHRDDCSGFFLAVFTRKVRAAGDGADETTATATDATADASADATADADDAYAYAEAGAPGDMGGQARHRRAGVGGTGGGSGGDASELQLLPPTADEWRDVVRFYGLAPAEGTAMLWAPGRAAKREKLYLASSSAAKLLIEHWRPAAGGAKGARRLRGRLHAVGVKAFERLKLTNERSRGTYECTWRPAQQALPYLLPRMRRRVLRTSDEAFFARTLEDRGSRADDLRAHLLTQRAAGLRPGCEDDECDVFEAGGAVLSLVTHDGEAIASVVAVLSPGGLQVWAPKEEVVGLLALLDR